jgi:NitT/TauT family transport system ATP-binding protein
MAAPGQIDRIPPEPILKGRCLSKMYRTESGEAVHAVDSVDLEVSLNDFLCIVGPSGCGKSTLLRIMAGLEQASSGQVLYHGRPVVKPDPEIGLVFQEYSLFPWLSVVDNVALGLEFQKISKAERRRTAMEFLRMVDMTEFSAAYPHELSGGMRQRVAIARSFAVNPEILLMDEPFGALDAHTRILLQKELLRIWERHKKTVLFVTHSVDEAIYLADQIIIMSARPGKIKEMIPVPMPRPRSRSHPAFGRLMDHILASLEEEVRGLKN